MNINQVLSRVRRAVDDYHMISENDHIAVGISGGKDSLALLHSLHELSRFYPVPYELTAITVNLGFDELDEMKKGEASLDFSRIKQFCDTLGIRYKVVKTDIAKVVFVDRKEKNPCALCAKMRKGALNAAIKEMGINKVAYAHHKDDVIETMLLSLLYEGRFYSFAPVTYLDRTDLTVIRPLLYMDEADVVGFVRKYELPVQKSPCPVDGHTKREYANELLKNLNVEHPGIRKRLFTAIKNSRIDGWEINA